MKQDIRNLGCITLTTTERSEWCDLQHRVPTLSPFVFETTGVLPCQRCPTAFNDSATSRAAPYNAFISLSLAPRSRLILICHRPT